MNQLSTISTNDIMNIAKNFVESGMFSDTKTMAQAFVKVQAGQEFGIQPFAAMSGIHIIQGKPTIGAGLMAASVKSNPKYDYKVLQHDEKACSIDFYQGKDMIGNSTFTIEDAKKAGTKNIDKFPKNMLFARAISNGVKWYCPDVFNAPVYTPEDFDVVTEDIQHEEVITDWQMAVDAIHTEEDLNALYRAKRAHLDHNDEAKAIFSTRKQQILNAAQ